MTPGVQAWLEMFDIYRQVMGVYSIQLKYWCRYLTFRALVQARDEVIDSICRKEVGVYSQIFSGSGDTAALDRTERRYLWLRNRLAKRAAVWAIFPEAWRLPHLLCLMFCSITKAQLAQSLDAKVSDITTVYGDITLPHDLQHPQGAACAVARCQSEDCLSECRHWSCYSAIQRREAQSVVFKVLPMPGCQVMHLQYMMGRASALGFVYDALIHGT